MGWISACTVRTLMISEAVNIIDEGVSVYDRDDDLEMLEKAFPANIKLLEALLATSPNNAKALVLLARLYSGYAFVFSEGKLEDALLKSRTAAGVRPVSGKDAGNVPGPKTVNDAGAEIERLRKTTSRYYRKGTDYALRAMEIFHHSCRQRLKTVSTQGDFFGELSEADVPALFWYGFNLGGYVNLTRGSIRVVSKAHLAEKAMKRVIELKPSFYHGAAHLFLLSYYASRPAMLGGNSKAARFHYDQIKTLNGDGYLLADFYYARYYLYQQQDREAFRQVLTRIVQYPETDSEFRLQNKVAVIRATGYLEAIDTLFQGKKMP